MKIKFQGFKWETNCQKLSISDFMDNLVDTDLELDKKKFYIIKNNDYYIGLLLSIKDAKKFTTLEETKKKIMLLVHTVGENESIVDFNFFIFNVKTKKGMYQYYHNSTSLITFCNLFRMLYREKVDATVEKKKKEFEQLGYSKNKTNTELKPFRGVLTVTLLEYKDNFKKRINALHEINKIEFDLIDSVNSNSPFSPLEDSSKNTKRIYSIPYDAKASQIKKIFFQILESVSPDKAKVSGVTKNGFDVEYKLYGDVATFEEYDYDDMVTEMSLDSADIEQSIKNNKIIQELEHAFVKNNLHLP